MPTALPRSAEPIRTPNNGADQGLMHFDSALGMLWLGLGDDRHLQVDGGRALGNLVYEFAEGISRRRHDTTAALQQLRRIRAQLPDGRAARLVDDAVDRLDAPPRPAPALPPQAPEPLHTLMAELGAINLVRRGGDYGTAARWHETDRLAELVTQWLAGTLSPVRFERAVRDLARQRHESQEGWLEIRDAVTRALADVRSWIRRPRQATATATAAAAPADEPAPAYEPEPASPAVATGEAVGLDQSIGYAQHLAGHARQHGPDGNEGYLARLAAHRITGDGLTTGRHMQQAFAAAAAAAAAHAAELTKQKTVQEAYDMTPDAGDKDFQTGAAGDGDEPAPRHRFDLLRDSVTDSPRQPLVEQAAAGRRVLLGQLDELADVLTHGAAAAEGITAAELAQIRSAALRLAAAAADTSIEGTRNRAATQPAPERSEPHPVEQEIHQSDQRPVGEPGPRRVSNSRGKQFEYDPGTGTTAVIEPDGWRAVVPRSSSTGVAARLLYWNAEIKDGRGDDATSEAARALMTGLSAAELRELADEIGAPARNARTKPQLIDTITNAAIDSARNARALRQL